MSATPLAVVRGTSGSQHHPPPFEPKLCTLNDRFAAASLTASPISVLTDDAASSPPASMRTHHLLYDESLMAASSRIGDVIKASAGVWPIIILQGHPDRQRWQLEVKLPGILDRRYVIVTQTDVICLGGHLDEYADTVRLPFEAGVEWLLSRPSAPNAAVDEQPQLRPFLAPRRRRQQ